MNFFSIGHHIRSSSARKTVVPSYLRDSVITDFVPQRRNSALRAAVTSCIDRMEEDFENRFSSVNTDVWSAMECLIPSWTEKFLNPQLLSPLFKYVLTIPAARDKLLVEGLNVSSFTAECQVFMRVRSDEKWRTERNV